MELPFRKMHGLGNDFVVIDARPGEPWAGFAVDSAWAAAVADRHTGVGCDQLVAMEESPGGREDVFMRIWNADGGEAGACGNAARCVGALLMDERGADAVRIRTVAGALSVARAARGMVAVDMGAPRFSWDRIPLSGRADTLHLNLGRGPLSDPAAASMGNPHATFFVDEVEAIPLAEIGPALEIDPLFPEGANIGVARIDDADRMRLRVWERGAGVTLACGTAACAAVANAWRRGLAGRGVTVAMDGGSLRIDWREDDRILMTGPAETSFHGLLETGS